MSQSKTILFHEYQGPGFYLAQFKTAELAIFSYYLQSAGQACLIDPTYDVYPYQELAQKRSSKIISILLTHYHADYLAGHTQFKLPIIMGPKSQKNISTFKLFEMADHYNFNVGNVWIKIFHTPGHTLESSCFLLTDKQKKQSCLFTGDTLFLGEVGRPDLAVTSNISKDDLAKMMFSSLEKLKKQVNHDVRVYPTHGAGSSCGKSISDGNFCTLQRQIENNYAYQIKTENEFVQKILSQMPKPPSYFFHDAKLNQTGGASSFDKLLQTSLTPLTPEKFKEMMNKNMLVIDTRHQLTGGCIKDCIMMTENGTMASWAGALIDPATEILLFSTEEKIKENVERLLRIGYFNIKGYNGFNIEDWKAKGFETVEPVIVDGNAMAADKQKITLDVRNPGEWKSTGVVENAKCISLSELSKRIDEVKDLKNIYINCKGGLRARVAASILLRNGIESKIVNEKFEDLKDRGLQIVAYE